MTLPIGEQGTIAGVVFFNIFMVILALKYPDEKVLLALLLTDVVVALAYLIFRYLHTDKKVEA